MLLSKKTKIIGLILIVLLALMFSGIFVLNHYFKPQANPNQPILIPSPTETSWFYNKKTENIEKKLGDKTFVFNKGNIIGTLYSLTYNPNPEGLSTGWQEISLGEKVQLFRLSGSLPLEKKMSLLVTHSEDEKIFGKIVRIGVYLGTDRRKAQTEAGKNTIFFLKQEHNANFFFMPITQEVANSVPDNYKWLYRQYISSTGIYNFVISYLSDPDIDSSVQVTKEMVDNCQNKLPAKPVDLNNPPEELKNAFDIWNETYAENENSANRVPVANFDQENYDLFRSIIPKNPAEPVAESSLRRVKTSEVLDQLESAVQQMWGKTDIKEVSSKQMTGCLIGAIAGSLATGPFAGVTAIGGTIGCGLNTTLINQLIRAIRGTNMPEAFTRTTIALYYETKLYDYLDCLQKQENYKNLPEDLRNKIELEKNRIEGEMEALTAGLQEGHEQAGSEEGFFGVVKKYIGDIIQNLLGKILMMAWGIIASAPL